MDVIEGAVPADLHRTAPSGATVVVLREPDSGEGVSEAARWLGADPDLADNLRRHPHRRPSAHVEGDRIAAVTLAASERDLPSEVHLHVGERGLASVAEQRLANGVTLHLVDEFEGQPIVFMHGLMATSRLFDRQIEHVSANARMIAPDRPRPLGKVLSGPAARPPGPVRRSYGRRCCHPPEGAPAPHRPRTRSHEQQENNSDDQPGDEYRDRSPHGGGVPAEPSVVEG